MKKMNHIVNKLFVIYAKNLVLMIKDIIKSEIIVITLENYVSAFQSIFDLRYETAKEIPVIFHNSSNYYYHFIIKELEK